MKKGENFYLSYSKYFIFRFTGILRDLLDKNLCAQYSSLAASQWLTVRLQLLSVVMISAISLVGVLETQLFSVDAGIRFFQKFN